MSNYKTQSGNYKTQLGRVEIPYLSVIAFQEMTGVKSQPATIIYLKGGATIVIYKDFEEYQKEYNDYWCRD